MRTIFVECGRCGEEHSVRASKESLDEYLNGALVQKVFPDLSVDERETLIGFRTGIWWCPSCEEPAGTNIAVSC
jgi:hypothetical protein